MNAAHAAYAVLGITVLVLSTAAAPIKRWLWVSEPMLAMLVGVLLGPVGVDLFEPQAFGDSAAVLEELARLTLAVSLMGVALRLPDEWIRDRLKGLLVLLGVGMPLTWLISSACAWLLLPLSFLHALILGAVLTPTDPVVASAIVTGQLAEESVDPDVRHLISAESGANDGLGFLFLMVPVLLMQRSPGDALLHWATVVLFGEVGGSILGGALLGYLGGKLLERFTNQGAQRNHSLLAVSLSLALLLLGLTTVAGGDGILAVFSGGLAFNWVVREEEGHVELARERVQEVINRFFDVPVFLFFGLVLPWRAWFDLGWPALAFSLVLLLVRRMPVILMLRRYLSPVHGMKDTLFLGWFGPMAVAAMVYATWAKVREGQEYLWDVASLTIFLSILIHGITATPLTRWYANMKRE